jgi:hypothetical protein
MTKDSDRTFVVTAMWFCGWWMRPFFVSYLWVFALEAVLSFIGKRIANLWASIKL